MVKAHELRHPSRWDHPSRQCELAEIVPIRPESDPTADGALSGLGITVGHTVLRIVQVFASLRAQATPVGSPPTPPSSPAPRTSAGRVRFMGSGGTAGTAASIRPGAPGAPGAA